ncbi:hypothetical protein F5887DRAFT_180050 [Amanita rubescens]|nr:hypothetical protein F5887DRAFT_180050 [Amanita rubescens]
MSPSKLLGSSTSVALAVPPTPYRPLLMVPIVLGVLHYFRSALPNPSPFDYTYASTVISTTLPGIWSHSHNRRPTRAVRQRSKVACIPPFTCRAPQMGPEPVLQSALCWMEQRADTSTSASTFAFYNTHGIFESRNSDVGAGSRHLRRVHHVCQTHSKFCRRWIPLS